MSEFRFRAFISYSHKDEAWAAWLHRALETYRVPRHLVGSKTSAGPVPARIRPVFRDRDDLSSATDLGDTVKQALSDSESLIVVCSPDAAASHWVNEEIRQFAALGRVEQIFCIIVDDDVAADGSVSTSFPAALSECGLREPLAADVRKWADGKQVARLKLIAGLLGIRLDKLRQRDLQRRRRRQLFIGLGIVAAVTLAVMTLLSQISERHEREKAEQLATFIVDLGERLKFDADLETLALISGEASRHLMGLDSEKLSPETGKKVALAFRQVAQVSQFQGKPDDALKAYQRSRDLLASLIKKYPDSQGLLFELGNAEYYIGNLYLEQDQFEPALASMQNYHRSTTKLLDMDPDNPDWILELSYSNNNLAASQLRSGRGINAETLAHVKEATRLMELVVALRPEDEAVASNYATTLAWAADAQFQSCNVKEMTTLRERVFELAEYATRKDPGNNFLKEQYAYALTGLARAQALNGKLELARKNLELAISILQQLLAADPGKVQYREQAIYRQIMLAQLLANTDQPELAKPLLQQVENHFATGGEKVSQSGVQQKEYIKFSLVSAQVEAQMGNIGSAGRYLEEVLESHSADSESHSADSGSSDKDIYDTQVFVNAIYQRWLLNGNEGKGTEIDMPETMEISDSEYRSCIEADSAARLFLINGDRDGAASEVAYLQSNGYADPNFVRFCQRHDLCVQ